MQLIRRLEGCKGLRQGSVAAIGNFDGVHMGHQALLQSLLTKAKALQCPLLVVLFEPQPAEYFQGDEAPARLSSLREKLAFLKRAQVDYVLCLKFNETLAAMEAEAFAHHYLFSGIHCKYLLLGEDFRFGYQRQGDIQLLKQLGPDNDCVVDVFPAFMLKGERVSSTKIREALKAADFSRVATYLGRQYSLCGRVVRGAGMGRQWGIPTANIKLTHRVVPLAGVFLVQVRLAGKSYNGVANIGTRPTVDGSKKFLEVHLLQFDAMLYGQLIEVFFLQKLRDEVKFESVEQLVTQIQCDIEAANNFFQEQTTIESDSHERI